MRPRFEWSRFEGGFAGWGVGIAGGVVFSPLDCLRFVIRVGVVIEERSRRIVFLLLGAEG